MSHQETELGTHELNTLRRQRRLWRGSTLVCVLGISLTSSWILRSSAVSLLQEGPTHVDFVAELNREITRQVFPHANPIATGIRADTLSVPRTDLPMGADARAATSRTLWVGKPASRAGVDDMPRPVAEGTSKALTQFRQQMVAEYEDSLNKIIEDLTAIRQADGGDADRGLPVNTVAMLLISRVQDAAHKPSLHPPSWAGDSYTSQDKE